MESSLPLIVFFCHSPLCVVSSAKGIFLNAAIIKANACSAVALVLPPGVFITTTPFSFAATRSMLSTPAPALAMALSFVAAVRIFFVTVVADLTSRPSYSGMILISSSSDKPVITSTEIFFSSNICSATLLIASEIRTLNIIRPHLVISPIYPWE